MKKLNRCILLVAGTALILGTAGTASAKKPATGKDAKAAKAAAKAAKSKKVKKAVKRSQKLRVANLESTMDGLKFGSDEAAALKWARLRLQHHYDPRLAKASGVEKQRWTEQIEKELEAIAAGVIEYKSGKTRVAMSIVGKDFGRVPGERLMTVKVGTKKHYLLFDTQKRLWRYATSVSAAKTFKERVVQYSGRIGAPSVQTTTPRAFAGWLFKTLRVELRDERTMYGGDALVVSHRALASTMGKLAKAQGSTQKKDATKGLEDVIDKDADKAADTSEADKELKEHERKKRAAAKKKKKAPTKK